MKILEFGSDFHRCDENFHGVNDFLQKVSNIRYYANGRMAIEALIKQECWNRIWVPVYFCYEVIEHIKTTGICVELYDDYPLNENVDFTIRTLPYKAGDVLLRMHYFGLYSYSNYNDLPVPVIEDFTHSLIAQYAVNSAADWCIASIRKSLPVAAGGILWSPQNKRLPTQLHSSGNCEVMSKIRYSAMSIKAEYLKYGGNKEIFRSKYLQSEKLIECLELSGIDKVSYDIFHSLDVNKWTNYRKNNWEYAVNLLDTRFNILCMSGSSGYPFSIIIICESADERTALKQYLIANNVFPAILWTIPNNSSFFNAFSLSNRMLSIHCDPRYSKDDIKQMCRIINSYYD